MYVKTIITLVGLDGSEADYEVGAVVTYDPGGQGWSPSHEVGEPEFSAPWSTLEESRLALDPQAGEVFPDGWSDAVEEALIEEHEGRIADLYDREATGRADYEYDHMKGED